MDLFSLDEEKFIYPMKYISLIWGKRHYTIDVVSPHLERHAHQTIGLFLNWEDSIFALKTFSQEGNNFINGLDGFYPEGEKVPLPCRCISQDRKSYTSPPL